PLFLTFFLLIPRHLGSTRFPYTTLFRSKVLVRVPRMPRGQRHDHMDALAARGHGKAGQPDVGQAVVDQAGGAADVGEVEAFIGIDRKSTRLNSSHVKISYAVFCLKKKKK